MLAGLTMWAQASHADMLAPVIVMKLPEDNLGLQGIIQYFRVNYLHYTREQSFWFANRASIPVQIVSLFARLRHEGLGGVGTFSQTGDIWTHDVLLRMVGL